MILPRNQIDLFIEFVLKHFGSRMAKRTPEQHKFSAELARAFVGQQRLLVIREFEPPPVPQTLPESVEVFSPDAKFLNQLSDEWNLLLMAASMKEESNVGSSDVHQPDNK